VAFNDNRMHSKGLLVTSTHAMAICCKRLVQNLLGLGHQVSMAL
jgi:hypothetical protein